MKFANYRSNALKRLWPKVKKEYGYLQMQICRLPAFSVWTIDNICAINWKQENSTDVCANALFDYIGRIC